jgi:putative spermidine/putrescine transport system permease protein
MATIPVAAPTPHTAPRVRLDRTVLLLSAPAFIAVLVLFVFPFLYGLNLSLHGGFNGQGAFTFDNYLAYFRDPAMLGTLWTTFDISVPVTILSVAVSVPLAYIMRRGIRFERGITAILILPITLGTVLVAQGMLTFLGPQGWASRTLQAAHLTSGPFYVLHTPLAVEISLFIQNFPFIFLLILGYMSAINPDLERASKMLGAGAWQTFWRVLLPLALPGIAVATCLGFVANFGVFPSAYILGEPTHATRVIAIQAYETTFLDYNHSLGTAIALIMGAVQLVVVGVVLWLQSLVARGAAISGGKGA